jgi:hypothetical protein
VDDLLGTEVIFADKTSPNLLHQYSSFNSLVVDVQDPQTQLTVGGCTDSKLDPACIGPSPIIHFLRHFVGSRPSDETSLSGRIGKVISSMRHLTAVPNSSQVMIGIRGESRDTPVKRLCLILKRFPTQTGSVD